jgi:hypothetical protein
MRAKEYALQYAKQEVKMKIRRLKKLLKLEPDKTNRDIMKAKISAFEECEDFLYRY